MEPSPTSRSYMSSMSSVGQLLLDNERAVRKLNKVRQRRDHYARLYFNTLSELEETKWKLNQAVKTIKELKTQGPRNSNSMPTVRRRVFHSNTTSPDSGASLSPGVESVEFGRHYAHSNPHSIPPHSNPNSGHHGLTPGSQYGNEPGRVPERANSEVRWRGKQNPSYYSTVQGKGGNSMSKPHPSVPLVLHPPPASRNGGVPRHMPPPQHHQSAFSPTRPNFVKSWSLSVNNLTQHQEVRQQQEIWQQQQWGAGQKPPHPPTTPLTATPITASSSSAVFTLPESYRETSVGVGPSGGSHAYLQRQVHLEYPPHQYQQQRSMTLPHSHAHPAVSRPPGPRTQYTSLSQDDLLDRPARNSAFQVPTTANPQYSSFLKHYHDNLEVTTHPSGPSHTHPPQHPNNHNNRPQHPGNHDNRPRGNVPHDDNIPHTPCTPPMPPAKPTSTEEGEGDDNGYVCSNLTSVDMLDLLLNISAPHCQIRRLEIQRSQLGEPEAMKLLCNSLARNHSITELSLPENGIGREALVQLLETIKTGGTSIKELKLRKNAIGQDCADLIKEFLTQTTLDSLVLTGNEIEQFGHLLDGQLPNEFSMEYSSDDSGVHTVTPSTNDPSPQISDSFKYLRL